MYFKPENSFINQQLSLKHEIYKLIDEVLAVCSFSLDAYEAFNNLYHNGIIFKLQQNGISDNY